MLLRIKPSKVASRRLPPLLPQSRTVRDLEVEIENMGGHLNAYTSREQVGGARARGCVFGCGQRAHTLQQLAGRCSSAGGCHSRDHVVACTCCPAS